MCTQDNQILTNKDLQARTKALPFYILKVWVLFAVLTPFSFPAETAIEAPIDTHALPFSLSYKATWAALNATSERSLSYSDDGLTQLHAYSEVSFLGKSIVRINEESIVDPLLGLQALSYQYKQRGIDAKERYYQYDPTSQIMTYELDQEKGSVLVTNGVYDELSLFLAVRANVYAGRLDFMIPVFDRNDVEDHHYRVLGEQILDTPAGTFSALHVERVRNPESKRKTEFWLSIKHDYILLKLNQTDTKGRKFILELTEGLVAGKALSSMESIVD
jgi:hypothetical protein